MAGPIRIMGKGATEGIQVEVGENGCLKVSDEGWAISDMDETTDPNYKYYGFVDKDGRWYIMRASVASPVSHRYSTGASAYTTAWANRTTLTDYDYYYNTF